MGNEEYKEIMNELYKFLRDKISVSLGEYLSDEAKEKLFSFDFENKIEVGGTSNKIVEYKPAYDMIYVCDEFLTPDYIEKVKEKHPDFDFEDLKNRINSENPKILLEELIAFCADLKLTEKDLIKSLFIQEILKMLLIKDDMDAKTDAIMTGTIELLAHKIGNQNNFLVGTPKKYEAELEVALGLKEELEDKFENAVLKENVLDYLSRIENARLLQKINELADNRKIIESTQNLDNVIDSIVHMTSENQEIINSVNEKEKEEVPMEPEEKKEDIVEIGGSEPVATPEPVVSIPSEEPVTIPANDTPVVEQAPVSTVETPVATMPAEAPAAPVETIPAEPTPAPVTNVQSNVVPETTVNKENESFFKKNKTLIIYSVLVLITVVVGIALGYLLFKYK